jgi:hypothetical protein
MAATGYILPAEVDLTALIGANFSTTINLYQDVAQTSAFDLTGYTCAVLVGIAGSPSSLFNLASGSGLTITAASGLIVAALTAVQTASVPSAPPQGQTVYHWQLKLTDGSGTISYPLSGNFTFANP